MNEHIDMGSYGFMPAVKRLTEIKDTISNTEGMFNSSQNISDRVNPRCQSRGTDAIEDIIGLYATTIIKYDVDITDISI